MDGRFRGARRRTITAVAGVGLLIPAVAFADALDDIRARGELIWGADQEGGGPYVYPDPDDPNRLIGFEVDLADALAKSIGVRARHYQADWVTLPEFLRSGAIDVVLNGYEWTPQRATQMLATRPYYIYELQFLARTDDPTLHDAAELRQRVGSRRRQVSVLAGSAAAMYLAQEFGEDVEIVEYNGNTDAMMQVGSGVHDATLQDLPIAVFYRHLPQERGLRFLGEPCGRGYYVALVRPGEERLAGTLNAAIETAFRDGTLRTIYERYGLWNRAQERLLDETPRAASMSVPRGWTVVLRYAPILLKSAGMTIVLSVLSMPLAIVLGLLIAVGRLYGPRPLQAVLAVYVEVLRGTPVMLQLYVIFFLLPSVLPVTFSPVVAAVIGLAVNYSAYEAEIYRAGLQAIPRGQMEAALALGMSRGQALRHVVVPQAVRIVVPPVTNDFIALFKDTSICSVIAVTELTKQYNVLANSTGAILELAAMTALLYLLMSFPLSLVSRRMERHLAGEGLRVAA
ncbi:MAG: ABC transporter substrate-binding protein/permease [Phycisphaerae bacterium]|nr:ABC transporter substrate-binding protein/permease [Phycisphaerae bacterium]